MSGNMRGYAWLDENAEHTEQEEARAQVLANRWSELHNAEEQRTFRREADMEEGRNDWEPEPCEWCGGSGQLGTEGPRLGRKGQWVSLGCGISACPNEVWGIKCNHPDCQDGYDMGPAKEAKKRAMEIQVERDLDIELIEDKLRLIGARMMRPYEHHNEDERYYEYMERDR